MKFSPCLGGDNCTSEGTHCQGCGRSHQEIAETKALIKSVTDYAKKMQYENHADFVNFFATKVLKNLAN